MVITKRKNVIPNYLVKGTDLFSLRLSNKKMTTAKHNNSRPLQMNQNCIYAFD